MKKIKKLLLLFVTSIFTFTSTGCIFWGSFFSDDITNIVTIEIEGPTVVAVDSTITLKATIITDNESKEIVWSSTNEEVAQVDENGVVTGIKVGSCSIIARYKEDRDYSAIHYLRVLDKDDIIEYDPSLTPDAIFVDDFHDLQINELKKLQIKTIPSNANRDFSYSITEGEECIVIDGSNNITAIKEGKVEIRVFSEVNQNVFATLNFNVYEEDIPSDLQEQVKNVILNSRDSVLGVANYQYDNDRYVIDSIGSGIVYKRWQESPNSNYSYYLLTNRHVVMDADKISIYIFSLDEEIDATLIQYDKKVDIAIVYFECELLIDALTFADSDTLESGTFAVALGNPEGFEFSSSATFGIISYPKRFMGDDTDEDGINDWDAEYIQHDVAINPGNSGGPLLNMQGQVIGINTLKFATTDIDNMGFSIPSRVIIDLIPFLERGENPQRIKLGIEIISVRNILAYGSTDYVIPEGITYGLYISKVTENSLAQKSGLLKDDILLEFMETKIKRSEELSALLGTILTSSNEEVKMKVYRNNEVIELTLVMD